VGEVYSGDNAGIAVKEQILIDVIQTFYGEGVSLLKARQDNGHATGFACRRVPT
jgi:hypothetical protein